MKRVGVREFRDHATQYPTGDEVLAVERHGEQIGFYIPTTANKRERFEQALGRLEQTVRRMVAETGLSEDELASLFDLNKPLPEPLLRDNSPSEPDAESRAASR